MTSSILIVDDQPELAGLMADLLADAGYAARTVENGPAALAEV
ncbi:MAG: response regulator, partial [Lysobacteraceae bacterium]